MSQGRTRLVSRGFGGFIRAVVVMAAVLAVCTPAHGDSTKTISGKLQKVKDNVLTVQKTIGGGVVEIEMDDHTKVKGQVAQGLHAKIKYREEAAPGGKGEPRRIAVEIETQPNFASKQAKEAAGASPPAKKDHP
jgi:hypothetical protein